MRADRPTTSDRRTPPVPVLVAAATGGLASALATLTMAWLLVQRGEPPIVITALYAFSSAPQLVVGLPAGALGDRIGHRSSVILAAVAGAIVLGALAVIEGLGAAGLPWVLAAGALLCCSDSLRVSNLQVLASDRKLGATRTRSLAALNLVAQGAVFAGSAAGGGLYGVGGPVRLFAIAAGLHAVGAVVLWRIALPSTVPHVAHAAGTVRSGLSLLRREPRIRDLMIVVAGAESLLWSTLALLPILTARVLTGGAGTLGVISACAGGGGLAALLWLARSSSPGLVRLLLGALVVGPLALLAESAGSELATACVALAFLGASLAVIDVATQTLMQQLSPAGQSGSVAGLWVLAIGSAPVGQMVAGGVTSLVGVRPAIASIGVVGLLFAFAVRRLPLLRSLRVKAMPQRSG